MYVGGDTPPSVSCIPSDARAPVRWRSLFGVYGELPSDYEVSVTPLGLNHTLSFPIVYESTPSRTEFFVCDLFNVELTDEAEISPQTVTTRFIQG